MSARPWVWFSAIAAVIVLPFGVAWPLGGLEDASKNTPPRGALGQKVTGHRFELTPRKAFYSAKEPNPSFGDAKPGRFVVLDLDVTNISTMPSDVTEVYSDVAAQLDGHPLDPVMALKDHLILRQGGDDRGGKLNPGLRESVRLIWEVPKEAQEPRKLGIAITDEEYQPSWSLLGYYSGRSLWYKQGVISTLETPLERA